MNNIVMIVPTGLGAEIGGHAGDAMPAAKMLAGLTDRLITHPNVLNASDINEMTENTLYVEGSSLSRFLEGHIRLKEVKQNKILAVCNSPERIGFINAVGAARTTIGADISIMTLNTSLKMKGWIDRSGLATGSVEGLDELVEQIKEIPFDALAVSTFITVDADVIDNYWKRGGTNPWGGIAAIVSKEITTRINKPCAHAPEPIQPGDKEFNDIRLVDPRMAAEMNSTAFIHCVFKGLHRAPRIGLTGEISSKDTIAMVSPMCWGRPHDACLRNNIPIIMVRENKTIFKKLIS